MQKKLNYIEQHYRKYIINLYHCIYSKYIVWATSHTQRCALQTSSSKTMIGLLISCKMQAMINRGGGVNNLTA